MLKNQENNYLEQTFLDDLDYKIWSTKEIQFIAHQRLHKKSKNSRLCLRILFVYFLAIALLACHSLVFDLMFNEKILLISIIYLSLVLVLFGQIENPKVHHAKAQEFYSCGVELANLHNVLIIFKSLIENQSVAQKTEFTEKIALSYQRIVDLHHSHEPIDMELYKCKTPADSGITWYEVQKIKLNYYLKTAFLYHALIVVPPVLLFILLHY